MNNVPSNYAGSLALQLIQSQGWKWRNATEPNIELEVCPHCKKDNYHLRMEIHGVQDPEKNRDGLHTCMKCGVGGSLYSLKQKLGLVVAGIESRKEYASQEKKIEELPDVDACHEALLADEDALDYLINGRGFTLDIIKQQKIGLVAKRYFRECGEVRSLVYPYLVNGNTVFVHYRTLPTMPLSENKVVKAFSSPSGWPVPLYNGDVLNDPTIKDIILVEGEPNTITALDHGVLHICGVPGANFKKAEWIDTLDKLERVYVCYDKDKVGQKASQELATRIGIEKCWKITLPDFEVTTEDGTVRKGKDLNEWFVQGGGTAEGFQSLKENAVLFDVDGVASSTDSVQEFYDELMGKESMAPKYVTPWPTLSELVSFEEGDVIDVLAPEKIGKTTFALNLMEFMVDTYGDDGVFICLEMTRARMSRKWVAHKGQVADNLPKNPEEAKALKQAFLEVIPKVMQQTANREGDLYFCYPKYKTVDDIYNLMRDCIRRYGVKWIAIDNIQRLADTTPRGSRNRTEHLSEISKVLSQLAKDYNVQMVRILQPNRIAPGKIVGTDSVDGSSQIAKDCDCMITLHRTKIGEIDADTFQQAGFIQQEVAFGDDMLVNVGLSRYSTGGVTTLHYNGATSTVMEKSLGQIAKAQAEANKNIGYTNQLKALNLVMQEKQEPIDTTGDITL